MYAGIVAGLSFLSISVSLALLSHHVYKVERTLTSQLDQSETWTIEHEVAPAPVNVQGEIESRHVLTKQALSQSLLYILAFIAVYFPPIIDLILTRKVGNDSDMPEWLFWLISLITPLSGVFNILIYTRPKVLRLREDFPNASFLKMFILIVLTGGEIPSLADLRGRVATERRQHHGDEVQGEGVQEVQFEDDRREYLTEDAIVDPSHSSNSLISYDLDVSSKVFNFLANLFY